MDIGTQVVRAFNVMSYRERTAVYRGLIAGEDNKTMRELFKNAGSEAGEIKNSLRRRIRLEPDKCWLDS